MKHFNKKNLYSALALLALGLYVNSATASDLKVQNQTKGIIESCSNDDQTDCIELTPGQSTRTFETDSTFIFYKAAQGDTPVLTQGMQVYKAPRADVNTFCNDQKGPQVETGDAMGIKTISAAQDMNADDVCAYAGNGAAPNFTLLISQQGQGSGAYIQEELIGSNSHTSKRSKLFKAPIVKL